jgi:hypothetical protein
MKGINLTGERPYPGDLIIYLGDDKSEGYVEIVAQVEEIPSWTDLSGYRESVRELGFTGWKVWVFGEAQDVICTGGGTTLVPSLEKRFDDVEATKYDLPSWRWPPENAVVSRFGKVVHKPPPKD